MARARLLIALVAATFGGASPAWAAGAHWYVSTAGSGTACTVGAPCATFATAIGKATDDDTIHIGPGTFTAAVDTAKRLTLIGAGEGSASATSPATDTFIDIPNEGDDPALALRGGGTVMHLRLRGQSRVGSSQNGGGPGLLMRPGPGANGLSYTVQDVVAIGGQNIAPQAGVSISNGGAPNRVFSVSIKDGVLRSAEYALRATADTAFLDVTGTLLDGGLTLGPIATATVRDVHSLHHGAQIQRGRLIIDHSRFDSEANALFMWASGGYARVTARNSVFAAANDGAFQPSSPTAAASLLGGDNAGEDSELTAIGSTFYSTGSRLHAGLYARRLFDRLGNVDVKLVNSVVRLAGADGVNTADVSVHTATTTAYAGAVGVSADHSAFSSMLATGLATATTPGSATNVTGDPLFTATPAGTLTGVDLSLADGSPLVDRADPALVPAGELDYLGAARSLDGDGSCAAAPDIGAFERPAKACVPAATPTPTPAPAASPTPTPTPDRVKPVITKLKLARTKATFTISERATVTVTIERAATGRRKGKRCVAKRRTGKRCTLWIRERRSTKVVVAGSNNISSSRLRRGRHRIRVTAVDAAGNTSAPARASLTVRA